jgi:hypothetical protein
MNRVASEVNWRAGQRYPLTGAMALSLNEQEALFSWAGIRPNGSEIPSQRCRDGYSPSGSILTMPSADDYTDGYRDNVPLVTQ